MSRPLRLLATHDGNSFPLQDGQTGASIGHTQVAASVFGGGFTLDTNRPWCTSHGWRIKAFDVTRQHFSNEVSVAACSAP
jgi:hypothetical protein